jgi:hypothetical protein
LSHYLAACLVLEVACILAVAFELLAESWKGEP